MFALAAALFGQVAACDQYLAKAFPPDKPGAAVAVVRHGVTLLAKGYGLADVGAKTPITRRTAFDLASVSKPFTALAVARLIDRGTVSPDDDVRKWLPGVPCLDPKRPVRVRDLLGHTSGLPDCYRLPGLSPGGRAFAQKTNADVLAAVAVAKPLRRPGLPGPDDPHDYQNTNYILLAELVRAADGRPLARFLADEVFAPLGMADTRVADAMPLAVPGRAAGYAGGKPRRADAAIHGDGNVFTTLDDLLRWDAAVTAGKLLTPATWKASWSPGRLDDGKPTGYGWGWGVQAGGAVLFHEGGWAGTRTLVLRQTRPAPVSVLVLANDERTEPGAVADQLLARLFGR